jgi:hypothetical protein
MQNLSRIVAASLILMLISGNAGAAAADEGAAGPKLANSKPVFPKEPPSYKRPNQYYPFAMRLSPDGKRVLYTRPVAVADPAARDTTYELILRELDGGKETVLPLAPMEMGWQSVHLRFNPFDPAGRCLALSDVKIEKLVVGPGAGATKSTMKVLVYDIAKAKADGTGIEEPMALAKFTADGQGLIATFASAIQAAFVAEIISLLDLKAKPLSVSGYIQSVCPAGDVAVFFVPPVRPAAPPAPGQPMPRPPAHLLLWDLKADKQVAELPMDPANSKLDDYEVLWTADGRYAYYFDLKNPPAAVGAPAKAVPGTRIWDRVVGKTVGFVENALPVGPGPGPSLMVLAKGAEKLTGGFSLHDADTGKEFVLGDAAKKLIHAAGGKVLYAETPKDAAAEAVFAADIVLPDSAKDVTVKPTDKPDEPKKAAPDAKAIAGLIEQLSNADFKKREETQAALVEIGEPAVAALQAAAKDKDPERSMRAAKALQEIENRQWGEAAHGGQIGLRAVRKQWKTGEVPVLRLEIRNMGGETLWVPEEQEGTGFVVSVDGHPYVDTLHNRSSDSDGRARFRPGEEMHTVVVMLRDTLREGGHPLDLRPGRHVIQVTTKLQSGTDALTGFGATSNPVEIEVLPAGN